MYKDIHVLDVETLTWVDDPRAVPPDYLVEVTNHQCQAIEAVPNYKLFCVTGKTGTMTYRCPRPCQRPALPCPTLPCMQRPPSAVPGLRMHCLACT